MSDLYARTDESPTTEQTQAVWAWVVALRHAYPDRAAVEGAYHAAEWLLGLTNVTPVSGAILYNPVALIDAAWTFPDEDPNVERASGPRVLEECRLAMRQAAGHDHEVRDRAMGAYAVLAWWVGGKDLPGWLVPDPRRLPARRGAA